ncbi:unnamed protein product [Caenorhabditis nigoni]
MNSTCIPDKLPCLPQYIYKANIYVICEDYTYHVVCLVVTIGSACVMVLSFTVLLMWNAITQLKHRTMSERTFQLQKAFLVALVIQILVPLCTFVIPAVYLWIAVVRYYYNQAFTNFAVCSISMHGFSSSIVMTLVHRPYRETLFSFFSKKTSARSEENSIRRLARYNRAFSVGVIAT